MPQSISSIPRFATVLLVAFTVCGADADINFLLQTNDSNSLLDVNTSLELNYPLIDMLQNNLLIDVNLNWTIPQYRESGDALSLSEIGGYNILYKRVGELFYYSILIEDPTVSSYRLNGLAPGLYEFVISAYDTHRVYSESSPPAYKMVE